ncbi:1-acyl-sn-glycerol-3-phosphate acyltransferase [Polynucleobacter paneuropaeus]|nr:1-acyl-sn-glycerol-3-phosphate acyltransferase [Polynucleobacter paneuropaeus]
MFLMQNTEQTPYLIRFGLWLLIILHTIRGVLTLSVLFPLLDRQQRDHHIQRWCKRLLKIFGLHLTVQGAELLPSAPYLLVSNHISWIDIHVINSFKPVRFVAKSEVASWPIFGWMAKQLGTVFIRRDSARHARQVVDQMAEVLKTESVCIFPEGTSSSGETVLPFKPNLFEPAAISHTPVWSLAISYHSRKTGERSLATAFIGDMGLVQSMAMILKSPDLGVKLHFLPTLRPEPGQDLDRKLLCQHSYQVISAAI